MKSNSDNPIKEPIGRRLDKIGKLFLAKLQTNLTHLDIERSFYPLLLIEAGNGLTQQNLAQKLNCDKVQVVRIIDYLSSNGYVQRVQKQLHLPSFSYFPTTATPLEPHGARPKAARVLSCYFMHANTSKYDSWMARTEATNDEGRTESSPAR